ncbi:non-canonical purine NTP pyrophosphatase [Vibrio harveyi]|nr:non-canonical purine NTP pyrophosphatase [Vibrio harveyi]
MEENGSTFEQNALIKAKDLAKYINGIAIGDDSGICVDILDNFPGIYSKR